MFELIRFWSDEGKAFRLARSLHKAALAWAEAFATLSTVDDRGLQQDLLRETLAFGLKLLQQRLGDHAAARNFADAVRERCSAIHVYGGKKEDRSGHAAADQASGSEFNRQFALMAGSRSARSFELTEEMFQEFCEFTGLGSRTLVGDGANLASLVFYMVVHGRIFSCPTVPAERRIRLMRAVRECRVSMEAEIERLVGGCAKSGARLNKRERPLDQAALPSAPEQKRLK